MSSVANTLYHGTAHVFDRFDILPAYFTPDLDAAKIWARQCGVSPPAQWCPVVLEIHVTFSNPMILTRAEFLAYWQIEHERDMIWDSMDNWAYTLQQAGHDVLVVRDMQDFGGYDTEGKPIYHREYDQYLVFEPHRLQIAKRILV